VRDSLFALLGVVRSLRIYYGDKPRRLAMDALYARFLRSGDLAFDIGSHVGDRVASFRRLGAIATLDKDPEKIRRAAQSHDRAVSIQLESLLETSNAKP
jgi:hypothetical protein